MINAPFRRRGTPFAFGVMALLVAVFVARCLANDDPVRPTWHYLSSRSGALDPPNDGRQQTACLALDIDRDGTDDFVVAERTRGPSVVWYKYVAPNTWQRYVIENEPLSIEAGGHFYDIDRDGDLDVVLMGDWRSDGAWWWENPKPRFDPRIPWRRRTIKSGDGARHQHDCRFGDFDGDGRVELAWWSQTAKKLLLARVPEDAHAADRWPYSAIFSWDTGPGHEGMEAADVDLDGKLDIVGAGYWFQHVAGNRYRAERIADRPFTRTAVGQILPGGRPEVVIVPGDGDGPLAWYSWDAQGWKEHVVAERIVHGHSLAVADVDNDGHLDLFVGEMGSPGAGKECKTRIYWGDGRGGFREQVIDVGKAHHESRLADLDGDGRLDILGKPYSFDTPRLHIWLQRR